MSIRLRNSVREGGLSVVGGAAHCKVAGETVPASSGGRGSSPSPAHVHTVGLEAIPREAPPGGRRPGSGSSSSCATLRASLLAASVT